MGGCERRFPFRALLEFFGIGKLAAKPFALARDGE
jgi:hypothetical protein